MEENSYPHPENHSVPLEPNIDLTKEAGHQKPRWGKGYRLGRSSRILLALNVVYMGGTLWLWETVREQIHETGESPLLLGVVPVWGICIWVCAAILLWGITVASAVEETFEGRGVFVLVLSIILQPVFFVIYFTFWLTEEVNRFLTLLSDFPFPG